MAWVTPKTNWQSTDYFNLTPDYARIQGNLLYLQQEAEYFYGPVTFLEMGSYTINDWPHVDFLNNIVANVQTLLDLYAPTGSQSMNSYTAGAPGWTSTDLNIIENNCLLFEQSLSRQKNAIPKLPMQLGLMQI